MSINNENTEENGKPKAVVYSTTVTFHNEEKTFAFLTDLDSLEENNKDTVRVVDALTGEEKLNREATPLEKLLIAQLTTARAELEEAKKHRIRCASGEPYFVLLGRDPQAPSLVRRWARERELAEPDDWKVPEARIISESMENFKTNNPSLGMARLTYRFAHEFALREEILRSILNLRTPETIYDAACALTDAARGSDVLVTIGYVPSTPYALGSYKMKVSCRSGKETWAVLLDEKERQELVVKAEKELIHGRPETQTENKEK